MARKNAPATEDPATPAKNGDVLREPAEALFAHEIEALAAADKYDKPPG